MIQIKNLHKSYGLQQLFNGINLQMSAGERLGLVGRNGHGKSTLFKIILGLEEHDEGEIIFPKNYRIGHLEQHLKFTEPFVVTEACLGLPPAESDDQYKAETILFGLGFTADDMYRAPEEFSGGFQIRLNLAKVLVSKPNLLLLDEPTNYLDIVSVRWLIQYLRSWQNEMIIISHDRDFMDAVTTHTASIHRQQLKKIEGPTAKLYEQIILEEEIHEKTRLNDDKKRKDMDRFIDRFRAKASKASVVQSRIKMRDRLPSLEKLSAIENLDFEFRHCSFPSKVIMEVQDLSFGYNAEETLIRDLSFLIHKDDRIGIIGKNGKGKSTLLNLLAGELKPTQGEIKMHPQASLGYFGQTNIDRLSNQATIESEIMSVNPNLGRTAIRNICGTMMFDGDKAEKSISVLSGGEKSRVMLGKILVTPTNLLFLDEPTNHLDMESIEALSDSIQDYPGAVLMVTHSEALLRELVNKLIIFHHDRVEFFLGDYDDFLEKIGWEEELPKKKKRAKKSSPSDNKIDEKQKRKTEKAIAKLEEKIIALETHLSDITKQLESEITKQNQERITALSLDIATTQGKIDECFNEMSAVSDSKP